MPAWWGGSPEATPQENTLALAYWLPQLQPGAVFDFGPGRYLLDAAMLDAMPGHMLMLRSPHVTIRGAGKDRTVLQLVGQGNCGIFGSWDLSGIEYRGIGFVGCNYSTVDDLTGGAIAYHCSTAATQDITGALVEDCSFTDFAGGGWLRLQANHPEREFIRPVISNCYFSGGHCRDPLSITASQVLMRTLNNRQAGFRGAIVERCVFDSRLVQMAINLHWGHNGTIIERNEIRDCGLAYPGVKLAYGIGAYGWAADCQINRNTITGAYTAGLYSIGARNMRVQGNTVTGQMEVDDATLTRAGISLAGFDVATLVGNTLLDNQYGLQLQGLNAAVSGNTIRLGPQGNSIGIKVRESAQPTGGHALTGNSIHAPAGNGTAIYLSRSAGAADVVGLSIADNTIRNAAFGMRAAPSGQRYVNCTVSRNVNQCTTTMAVGNAFMGGTVE